MTVIDTLRTARDSARGAGVDLGEPATPARFAVAGALTAAASALVALLLAAFGWVSTGQTTVGFRAALGIGADAWLLAHGARIGVGTAYLALTPLLWWALVVGLVAVGVGRLMRTIDPDGPRWRGLLARPLAVGLVAFTAGYAAVATLVGLLTLAGPARPSVLTAVPALLLTVAVGLVVALARTASLRGDPSPFRVRRLPTTLRRAVPAALWGAGAVIALGSGLVVLTVLARLGSVRHVGAELAPGLGGGLLLWLGQLLYLPNLALWAVSFVAGSGFQVPNGAGTTWSGAHSGLLPMVPVFGALPSPGAFPWFTPGVVILPVAVGALTGRRSLQALARLSRLRTKASVAVTAAAGSALLLGALDLLAGGSLGAARLSHLGAPALTMTLLLAVELSVGALGFVAWDCWRLHRR